MLKQAVILIIFILIIWLVFFIVDKTNDHIEKISDPSNKEKLRLFTCRTECDDAHPVSDKNRNNCYLKCKG